MMSSIKKTMLLLALAANATIAVSQTAQAIARAEVQTRQGEQPDYTTLCSAEGELLLSTATRLAADSIPALRDMAVALASCALKQQNQAIVMQTVELLCLLTTDTTPLGVDEEAAEALTACRREDFSEKAKNDLATGLRSVQHASGTAIRLAGYLYLESAREALQSLSTNRNAGDRRWDALLALARMGNPEAVGSCMGKIRRVGIGDNLVYRVMPDLAYLHRPEAVAYLVEVLNSNEKLCSSPNPDSEEHILCGYRVMEWLADMLKGFPLQRQPSGDIEVDDYDKALRQAREWCAKQNGSFTIIDETF